MKTYGTLIGNIAYWQSKPNQWLVSYEDIKKLMEFETLDDVINYLYLDGHKEAARELNRRAKEGGQRYE